MKRLLTLMTAALMVLMMCFIMTACGGSDDGAGDDGGSVSQSEDMQGYAGSDGASLADVNEKNYVAVAEDLFGLDLEAQDGWEVQEAVSYNGVNNLTVKFSVPEGADGGAISKAYFDQCLGVSEDGVYAQDIDMDAMTVSKGAAYTDFETFFATEGTQIESFYSSMWIYSFGGKSIQFSVSVDTGVVEVTLTLLG